MCKTRLDVRKGRIMLHHDVRMSGSPVNVGPHMTLCDRDSLAHKLTHAHALATLRAIKNVAFKSNKRTRRNTPLAGNPSNRSPFSSRNTIYLLFCTGEITLQTPPLIVNKGNGGLAKRRLLSISLF